MADDSEIVVKISADIADMRDALKSIQEETGKVKNVAGVNIDNVVGKLFVFKAGAEAVAQTISFVAKTIDDVVVQMAIMGEKLQQVENGFNRSAQAAGINGEALKDASLKASDGILDVNDLLRRSTELITVFGQGALKIPQLIELSRSVAKNYGDDFQEVFNSLSEAVRNGNTRLLKHYGIIIDSEKAVKNFAEANGVAANALSEQGRSQAILNAVLDQGNKKFAANGEVTRSLGESYAAMKVAVHDAFEELAIYVDNRFGPTIQKGIDAITGLAHNLTDAFKSGFKSDEASMLNLELQQMGDKLDYLRSKDAKFIGEGGVLLVRDDEIAKVEEQMAKVEANLTRLNQMRSKVEANTPKEAAPAGDANAQDIVDKKKLLDNEIKFQNQIADIRLAAIQSQVANAETVADLYTAQQDRMAATEEQYQAKRRDIQNNDILIQSQKNQILEQMEIQHIEEMRQLELAAEQEAVAASARQLNYATSFNDQIAASAENQSLRAAQAWKQSGQLGGTAMQAFSNRTIAAFTAMGNGSQSAGEALKGAFFGMLGDMASAQGQFMFLSSLWPPNPVGMAAGLGLIALGGLLSSMGGGGSSSVGSTASAGGGGGTSSPMAAPSVAEATPANKSVSINIEGNYFDNEQTRLSIVEAIRSANDANDFTINRGTRY